MKFEAQFTRRTYLYITMSTVQFENIAYMTAMSLTTPMILGAVQSVGTHIAQLYPSVVKYFRGAIIKPTNQITIKRTSFYTEARGWIDAKDDIYNMYIINAVLMRLERRGIIGINSNANMVCNNIDANSTYERLKSQAIVLIPCEEVKCDGMCITLNQTESVPTEKSDKVKTFELIVKSKLDNKKIKEFMNDCYIEYINTHYKEDDKKKYYYIQYEGANGNSAFRKYDLNLQTSFDNLYFPEKNKIIELIDKLNAGEISKLGLLLHGLPGCGKSSVIKAISTYTGRHIISVKLSLIKSDMELMDILFGNTIIARYNENNHVETVPREERVYVFEDIDADDKVVHQRPQQTEPPSIKEVTPKDIAKSVVEKASKYFKTLTLSGLLNALDGVLELNKAIIVMTTNHVEKLDKALIRPGRITLNIELKKMLAVEANKMIRKHFGQPSSIIRDYELTPATLEAFIQASSGIEELEKYILGSREQIIKNTN